MTAEMRKTGIDVVGDMPRGTHFCVFLARLTRCPFRYRRYVDC
jgi:hypothetical protein